MVQVPSKEIFNKRWNSFVPWWSSHFGYHPSTRFQACQCETLSYLPIHQATLAQVVMDKQPDVMRSLSKPLLLRTFRRWQPESESRGLSTWDQTAMDGALLQTWTLKENLSEHKSHLFTHQTVPFPLWSAKPDSPGIQIRHWLDLDYSGRRYGLFITCFSFHRFHNN